ncbi:hypothetical protein N5D61_22000 [Pseudomonas sp. GD03842]|uniref:hypothetical protein n=1 Tax=Pseudomonas sp. GD03842 TaxID=2975385 RepID=UPI00244AFC91|nr:hypothetical protein [Pseudomonas sp. GD03842]MDH0749007.1 hypothetical protein [Pseudomonas sp. GD03842]
MKTLMLIMSLLMLGGCTTSHVPSIANSQQMASGVARPLEDLEDRLTNRYISNVAKCSGDRPAYNCSGLLIRRANYNPSYDFWGLSADAIRLGSTTFSYIRSGVNSDSSDLTNGFIRMDPDSAQQAGKLAVNARCIYPFMADTQENNRAMHGCGFANGQDPIPLPADLASCATLSMPATSPDAWIENFISHGSSRINQCSLSTKGAAQFITSLTVRPRFPDLTRAYGNEILFENWNTADPARLPIEAIFYEASRGSLLNAQQLKLAYQAKSGIELPIVRIDLTNSAKRFTVVRAGDGEGALVAQRLNARHANLTPSCAGGQEARPLCTAAASLFALRHTAPIITPGTPTRIPLLRAQLPSPISEEISRRWRCTAVKARGSSFGNWNLFRQGCLPCVRYVSTWPMPIVGSVLTKDAGCTLAVRPQGARAALPKVSPRWHSWGLIGVPLSRRLSGSDGTTSAV